MHLKAMQWAGVIAVFIGLGCEVLEKAFCKHKKPPAGAQANNAKRPNARGGAHSSPLPLQSSFWTSSGIRR